MFWKAFNFWNWWKELTHPKILLCLQMVWSSPGVQLSENDEKMVVSLVSYAYERHWWRWKECWRWKERWSWKECWRWKYIVQFFCSEPASSYDVTFALHHKDESTITVASRGERKPPIFLDISVRVKWEWFKNPYIFVPHVLQHPQLSVRSLCVYCWLQVKWFLPQEIIQEIEHKKLYVRNNAQKIIHEK